eukprot:TRINITY_DN7493_c0_g1_i1.p1 TRINITY_DN7493_c0_g1~~TRINITY_DN7493_c0_g1_i1.p1  ORF type:complete len:476 (-),score=60.22 TRINITY_DN7493_c0_g1_i1:69-1496(-)
MRCLEPLSMPPSQGFHFRPRPCLLVALVSAQLLRGVGCVNAWRHPHHGLKASVHHPQQFPVETVQPSGDVTHVLKLGALESRVTGKSKSRSPGRNQRRSVPHAFSEHAKQSVDAAAAAIQAKNLERRDRAHLGAAFLTFCVFLAMLPILVTLGVKPFLVTVTYLGSLVLVIVTVKDAIAHGYSYPYTITMLHLVLTFITHSLVVGISPLKETLGVLPISAFNGAALLLNNSALLFGTAVFVTMIGTCTPATTFAVEALLVRGTVSSSRLLAVGVVCAGALVCIHGELTFSAFCFLLATLANFCRSLRTVIQHDLLIHYSPARLVATSSMWSFLLILPLCLAVEGVSGFTAFAEVGVRAQTSLVASSVVAVSLNMSQCFALSYLGPVLVNTIGNLQIVLILVVASAMLDEEVRVWQWLGVAMITGGCALTKRGKSNVAKASSLQVPAGSTDKTGQRDAAAEHVSGEEDALEDAPSK